MKGFCLRLLHDPPCQHVFFFDRDVQLVNSGLAGFSQSDMDCMKSMIKQDLVFLNSRSLSPFEYDDRRSELVNMLDEVFFHALAFFFKPLILFLGDQFCGDQKLLHETKGLAVEYLDAVFGGQGELRWCSGMVCLVSFRPTECHVWFCCSSYVQPS